MKISEMIKNLQKFMAEHGDVNCYCAADDEGNYYYEVFYAPSLYYTNKDGDIYSPRDIEYEKKDIEDFEKICVVN